MALIKCSECGSDVSEKALECPKCGCPIELTVKDVNENKKMHIKKITLRIVLIVGIAFIMAILIWKIATKPDISGYYEGIKWGTSLENIEKRLDGEDTYISRNEDTNTISYIKADYDNKSGVDALIYYEFDSDMLKAINVCLTNGDESAFTDGALIDEYMNKFNDLYGEAEESLLGYVWKTEKSEIELTYLGSNLIIINYKDINKIDN